MPTTSKKKPVVKELTFAEKMKVPFVFIKMRTDTFLSRRPHRSFRLTRRRDYKRSLKLPGYVAFTKQVSKTLLQHKKVFIWLVIVYAVLTSVFVGISSQSSYSTILTTLQTTGSQLFQGNVGQLGQAALLLASIGTSGLSAAPTDAQAIYMVILGLLIWLTTVWLLRGLLAGHKVKMRDGLYNASAPIISTLLVALVFVVQLIPIGIAVIGFAAANTSGLLDGGVAAMLFWFAAAFLVALSFYWLTSTFFALIIVTLPGMYPMKALRTAGDMLVGRRIRVLLRILWMLMVILISAIIVFIPIILLDTWVISLWPGFDSVPVVPVVLTLFSVSTFIWAASYVYLLYRRVVDDDAKPAL
jgi:hypothetical protein